MDSNTTPLFLKYIQLPGFRPSDVLINWLRINDEHMFVVLNKLSMQRIVFKYLVAVI